MEPLPPASAHETPQLTGPGADGPTAGFAQAESVLRDVFGFAGFRPHQDRVIRHLLDGHSALLVMPTGAGKSLCYQVPALVRRGTGIVVSPLIALMQDQVDSLAELGVRAAFLNSSQSGAERHEVLRRLRAGAVDLLYVAPERAVTDGFLQALDDVPLALLAIDEAHCISQWGHEFRPEYRQLSALRERWPQVPCLAATATADEATRGDVASQLGLAGDDLFVTGFDRPNLHYSVVTKVDARKQLLAWLSPRRGSAGIVYCGTRKKCEQVAGWLNEAGYDASPYHAGMEADQRAAVQRRFLREESMIVAATVAFGMGIDKPDVRFVAHLDIPKSLEAYYQESGRAGRDGQPADCWMTFGWQDVVRAAQFIGEVGSDASTRHRSIERRKLDRLVGWTESAGCRREALLRYFGEEAPARCGRCDNCDQPPERWDATREAQMLLSCVYRTGQRFGVVHVVEVLLGNDTDKIRRFGHDRLSTYGIGTDHDALTWRSIARQLVSAGILSIDLDQYGALKLTESSGDVLKGRCPVELKRDAVAVTRSGAAGSGRRRSSRASGSVDDPALSVEEQSWFDKLRALRAEIAREQDVPAYVIFHDRSLREMARYRPTDLTGLSGLHGVGATKLDRYGQRFLDCLNAVE